jgi:protein-tyrosine kinase
LGRLPARKGGSLVVRAAEAYDLAHYLRAPDGVPDAPPTRAPRPASEAPFAQPKTVAPATETKPAPIAARVEPVRPREGAATIDRTLLADRGLLVPGAPIGALAEEFRLIKRQLLATAKIVQNEAPAKARTMLVCSAQPNDGKTYCALNLAISLAAERDTEVLLIDADFAKPDVLSSIGLKEGPGLLDALADATVNIENCVIATDIARLSVLPAGTKTNTDTELLASKRTAELIAALLAADPKRILLFDSPPVLAASPASVLAGHVGQVMLVVRADRTSDGDLREAVAMLDGCDHIQLVLNAVSYAPGGRRFGSYYGQEDAK